MKLPSLYFTSVSCSLLNYLPPVPITSSHSLSPSFPPRLLTLSLFILSLTHSPHLPPTLTLLLPPSLTPPSLPHLTPPSLTLLLPPSPITSLPHPTPPSLLRAVKSPFDGPHLRPFTTGSSLRRVMCGALVYCSGR